MMGKRILALLLTGVLLCGLLPWKSAAAEQMEYADKPLEGKYISIMGDSISTYMGWSDSRPIADETCAYRYGEPYYGPVGSDCHNTDLLVEDTWWHQGATRLGAQILVSNAANSTGLLHASYPANEDWQQYLQDLLAYKSRPYYMGADGIDPDIIALYIGSGDVRMSPATFGTLEEVDLAALIVSAEDGGYTYAEPVTVAEAYCILLHKLTVTYPKAEICCFTVVPDSGGNLEVFNKRLAAAVPYNAMIKSVAEHYGALVVDLFAAYELDADGDGAATQEELDRFKTFYCGDPHPNAAGFDRITECFVDTLLENSRYIASVETSPGNREYVGTSIDGDQKTAYDYVTESGMIVDYRITHKPDGTYSERYKVTDRKQTYLAEGGEKTFREEKTQPLCVLVPTEAGETISYGRPEGELGISGDVRSGKEDGVFDYRTHRLIRQASVGVKTLSVLVREQTDASEHLGMTYVSSQAAPVADIDMIPRSKRLPLPQSVEDVPAITPGYEYVLLGSDLLSSFWAAYAFSAPDGGYPNETPLYSDENISLYVGADHNIFYKRKLVVPTLYLPHATVEKTDKGFPARYESVQQFTLTNGACQILTAYCADQKTPAENGYSYRIANLEDATYYSDEEARMIRTIANNGYWGTDSGFGSLAAVKEMMRASGKFTEEDVAAMTDGMAMTATQYAIWTFSNAMDEKTFVNVYGAGKSGVKQSPEDQTKPALIFKLYHHLISLPPTTASERPATRNVIINEKNFLKQIQLSICDKPDGDLRNQDEDDTNDVYTTDISFSLAVTPSTENGDDLVVKVENEEKVCIALGRIAGALQEGETLLVPDDTGVYSFRGIPMEEGGERFSFVMQGTQNLEKTPHLLTSEIKDGVSSQTMVCVAEGDRKVNVGMDIAFEWSVTDEVISTLRQWRTEEHIPEPTTEPTTETTEATTVPDASTDVPSTKPEPPRTGDAGDPVLWAYILYASLLGMAALFLLRRRIA